MHRCSALVRPLISLRVDGTIGGGNAALDRRPTSGWDTRDVMPDMVMEDDESGSQSTSVARPGSVASSGHIMVLVIMVSAEYRSVKEDM
mmetsp:Transcript_11059/g.19173  ORF Transcript_11059/g.19173 Transcript_11059/m.19173 type:complete len:89 (+) Transcript_11059:1632-1898(+)